MTQPSLARRVIPLASLTIAYPLLHKPVSDIFDWASGRWGFAAYQQAMLVGIPAVCAIAVLPLVIRRRGALFSTRRAGALLALAAGTVAGQHWLMVVNVELIHLPQFAIVSAAALALGAGPHAAFLVGSAAGIVDETYQHLVIYAGRAGTYFDINDIVLNALGAAWGVVLFARSPGARERSPGDRPRAGRSSITAAALVVCVAIAWWIDPPVFQPWFAITPASRKFYRILSAPEGVVWCAAAWLVVALALRPRVVMPALPQSPAASTGALLVFTLTASLAGCAVATTPARVNAGPPDSSMSVLPKSPFITTFWCGPPLDEFTDERAAEIVAAGFTDVGSPCEGAIDPERNRRALDVAAKHGLRLTVTDGRFAEYAIAQPDWERQLDAAVEEYNGHPGLGAYFVSDEPSAAEFANLARITGRLRRGSSRPAYINLLPDFIPGGLGVPTYREYVERFVTTVQPSLVSYDYYPFGTTRDRQTFFANLRVVREVSQAYDVPFMLIVQAMPHGPYRDPTAAEISWQALHALAYGARGLSYFAYWTPVNVKYAADFRFRHGLIEHGKPTRHYFEAMRLNRIVRTIARELEPFRSTGIADSRGEVAEPFPLGPVASAQGGAITAGLFEDAAGRAAVLLVNRDYTRSVDVTLRWRENTPPGERLVLDRGEWTRLGEEVELTPGGAALLRWTPSAAAR